MDAKRSREHFRTAIAAARPQERLQLRRMAEASLALPSAAGRPQGRRREARPDAADRPSAARAPRHGDRRAAPSAGNLRRILGILILVVAIVLAILLGWAIVKLVALPFGGINTAVAFFWGFMLAAVVLGVLIVTGADGRSAHARGSPSSAPSSSDANPSPRFSPCGPLAGVRSA